MTSFASEVARPLAGLCGSPGFLFELKNEIEADGNQANDIAEDRALRRFPSQHVELLTQRQDLRFKLCS
jgi:hypothetical protein